MIRLRAARDDLISGLDQIPGISKEWATKWVTTLETTVGDAAKKKTAPAVYVAVGLSLFSLFLVWRARR